MARPKKNNADYFSHDTGMRNHRKIKAVRGKFGITGYAVFNMLLELLTDADYNRIELTDIEYELISGDFGISSQELQSIVDYCVKLGLFVLADGVISSTELDKRLASVYEKRDRSRENVVKGIHNRKQKGQSATETEASVQDSGISVTEMRQKKVNKKKAKEIKRFVIPDVEQIKTYCIEKGYRVDPEHFYNHYQANGWMRGGNKIKDWKAALRTWEIRGRKEVTSTSTILSPKTKQETIKILEDAKF